MSGDYDGGVEPAVRDAFLYKNKLYDRSLSEEQLTERYVKFKDVSFGLAPEEMWPNLFEELLEFEHAFAGS